MERVYPDHSITIHLHIVRIVQYTMLLNIIMRIIIGQHQRLGMCDIFIRSHIPLVLCVYTGSLLPYACSVFSSARVAISGACGNEAIYKMETDVSPAIRFEYSGCVSAAVGC